MANIQQQIYIVNSRGRITGTDSNFTYLIPIPIGAEFDSVAILQASIPKSYYLIDSGKDTFTVVETAGGIPLTYSVQITSGNYTRRTFALTIGRLLTAASLANGYGLAYSLALPSSTSADDGKYTYTITGAADSVVFTMPAGNTPSQQLGFDPTSSTQVTLVAGVGTVRSANVCKLVAEDTLFIRSDICRNGSGVNNNFGSVLQEVFTNVSDYSSIIYSAGVTGGVYANRRILGHSQSNTFRFILTDEDGAEVSLNGINMVFSLLLYKFPNTLESIRPQA